MTKLAYTPAPRAFAADDSSIMQGAGTGMFTSGSAPAGSQMMTGDAVDMFTTSCIDAPQSLSAEAGEGVEMFTTSCVTADSDAMGGNKVEMFTTSCVTADSDALGGNKVALFTTSC